MRSIGRLQSLNAAIDMARQLQRASLRIARQRFGTTEPSCVAGLRQFYGQPVCRLEAGKIDQIVALARGRRMRSVHMMKVGVKGLGFRSWADDAEAKPGKEPARGQRIAVALKIALFSRSRRVRDKT